MAEERRAVKLLQGYVWHPREMEIDLGDYLPSELEGDLHVLWDALPQAPFTFFDDGTFAATQQLYQLTVLALVDAEEDIEATLPGRVPWLAETLQERLERTPDGVGWQVFEDLREIG